MDDGLGLHFVCKTYPFFLGLARFDVLDLPSLSL